MIEKLERKFGKYAIRNLMKYVIIVYIIGLVIGMIPGLGYSLYFDWLMLDVGKVLQGQVWRLFTFVLYPSNTGGIAGIFLTAIELFCFYSIGTALENTMGSFRFNLYYFSGMLFIILANVIVYIVCYIMYGKGMSDVSLFSTTETNVVGIMLKTVLMNVGFYDALSFMNWSMIFAFAMVFPDLRFSLMFLIPIKAKYMAIVYVVYYGYQIFEAFSSNVFIGIALLVMVAMPLLNAVLFSLTSKKHLSPSQIKRRHDFRRSFEQGVSSADTSGMNGKGRVITRHKCAVCGRTELDNPDLQFRFCSKCNGNYEYCQDHLFTHEHIQ